MLRGGGAWGRRRNGGDLAGIDLTVEAFEVGAEFRRDLVADGAIFFESLVEDALKLGGDVGIQGDRSDGSVVQNVIEDDGAGSARKGLLAGKHLIEHGAEREEVASSVKLVATRLFGRHVGDGADGGAGPGEEPSLGYPESFAGDVCVVFGEGVGEAKI